MTPSEKLKEIEERLSGQQARCIAGSFKLIQEARHDFALNGPNDIHWLISRVKQLEAALEIIVIENVLCDWSGIADRALTTNPSEEK